MNKEILQLRCKHCLSRLHSVFSDLDEEELCELNLSKTSNNFKKGQTIFSEGAVAHGIFCVNSGKIKISQSGDEGKEQIVRFAKEGDILGYMSILSGDKYSTSATALEEATVCFIPRITFFSLIGKNPHLSLEIMKLLALDLKKAEHTITDMSQKPIRERMAVALLFLKETYGYEKDTSTINVSLSREEIANMVGTSRESATRLLSEFKEDGILELDNKKIKILNQDKLIKTANIVD